MTEIPKLVSLAYCFWLKFVSSSSRTKNSTIDSLISCFDRRSRNRWVSVSLSPTLTLFLAPHGELYLRLQERVPESESVRLAASTPPKTMASSIEILDAIPQATDFSNGYPK